MIQFADKVAALHEVGLKMVDQAVGEQGRKATAEEFHDRHKQRRTTLAAKSAPQNHEKNVMSNRDDLENCSDKKWHAIAAQSRESVEDWMKENCNGAVVLDYGCGLDENSLTIAARRAHIHVADNSPEPARNPDSARTPDPGHNKQLNRAKSLFSGRDVRDFYLLLRLAVPFHISGIFKSVLDTLKGTGSATLKVPDTRRMVWQMIFLPSKLKAR